tara:strand:+ start:1846 stop:3276 length:1431 start_codon:yes stop_codon:yes gene_type:complete
MAYTIEQKPNQLAAANSPMVFVLKESSSVIYNADKFRYIAQVYISTTNDSTWVETAKIKIHKNNSNVGIVDIHKIVRTYLETQEDNIGDQETIDGSIHSIGISETSNSYSQNRGQLVGVKLVGGYEKADSATEAPTETLNQANEIIYSIPASTPYTKVFSNIGGLDIDGTNNPLTSYIPNNNSKLFLSNAPRVQFVRGSSTAADNVDELTVAFIQNGLITDGAAIGRIYIKYYNSSGVAIAGTSGGDTLHYFTNDTASGGKGTADDVKNSLLYFGCGTANLQNQEDEPLAKPSNFSNWAYYEIYGTNALGNATETTTYYFYRYGSGASVDDRHQSCTRYDNIRLAWRNRLGAWDYMNFRGKSTESVDITRSDMGSVPGTWDSLTFNYDTWDRGKKTLYTEATRKLTINSDWLNPDEGAWLEELFTSTNVQILGDDSIVYPVILTDKTYTKKTSVNNKIKIQYTIKLEYANKVRTNS